MHVVHGQPQLVEIGAHRATRDAFVAQIRDRRVPVPLGELLPILAKDQPVMDHLGQLRAQSTRDRLVQREIRPVVGAADDVRDAELEIVDNGRELVGRCAVLAQERRTRLGNEPHRPVRRVGRGARLEHPLGRGRVDGPAVALADRSLVPPDLEPSEIGEHGALPTRDGARRVGVIQAQDELPATGICERTVRDGVERIADVQ